MISKKKRDAKFIIYQSLYLIAIALIALSGATLIDLGPKNPNNMKKDNDKIFILKTVYDTLKENNFHIDSNETVVPIDSVKKLISNQGKTIYVTKRSKGESKKTGKDVLRTK